MNAVAFFIAVIFGLMLAEQRVSARHEQLLREEGAIEPRGDVYAALALTYPAAFLAMGLEGIWRASRPEAAGGGPSWAASGVVLFVASKALKYWAIRALGHRWSFRVLVLPGRPLVSDGPYRYVDHPNYIAVIGELVATALIAGARVTGPIAGAGFGIVLWKRWQFERRVLADARAKRVSRAGVD